MPKRRADNIVSQYFPLRMARLSKYPGLDLDLCLQNIFTRLVDDHT
jgi:hypothetical protein